MPILKLLTPDGQMRQLPIPAGMNPTPEEVGEMVRNAGIQTVSVTKQTPDADAGAGASGNPPGTPTTPGEAARKSLTSIYRAIADRTVDPAKALLDPSTSIGGRVGAGVQLASLPASLPFAAAGAGLQAATEAAGFSPGAARMVGSATEIGAGIMRLGHSVWSARSRATEMLGAVRQVFQPKEGMGRAEQIGSELQGAARAHFAELNKTLGSEFDRLEGEITRTTPKVLPGTPAYGDLDHILHYVDDAQASAGPRAETILRRIQVATHPAPGDPQQPINMKDLLSLRKLLHERAGVANIFDPDASVVGKKAAEMRDLTMDVIRGSADEGLAGQYDMARNAWKTQLVEPETFLKAVTRDNTTPLSAFKSVFASDDPQRLRVMSEAIGKNPKVAMKLKLGFAEAMGDVLSGDVTSKATLARLENFRPLLEHTGLYTAREMEDLKFLVESNQIPSLISELTSTARSSQVMLRGALGASMATHISSHPLTLLVSALASGGIPQMRRAAMLPAGSMAQKQLLSIVARNTASGLRRLFGPQDEPGVSGSRAAVR